MVSHHIREAHSFSTPQHPRGLLADPSLRDVCGYNRSHLPSPLFSLHKCHGLFSVLSNTHKHETKAAWGDEKWGMVCVCWGGQGVLLC